MKKMTMPTVEYTIEEKINNILSYDYIDYKNRDQLVNLYTLILEDNNITVKMQHEAKLYLARYYSWINTYRAMQYLEGLDITESVLIILLRIITNDNKAYEYVIKYENYQRSLGLNFDNKYAIKVLLKIDNWEKICEYFKCDFNADNVYAICKIAIENKLHNSFYILENLDRYYDYNTIIKILTLLYDNWSIDDRIIKIYHLLFKKHGFMYCPDLFFERYFWGSTNDEEEFYEKISVWWSGNIDIIDMSGNTFLMYVISRNTNSYQVYETNYTISLIKYLLKNGANPLHKNDRGETPLSLAVECHYDILQLILTAASTNNEDDGIRTIIERHDEIAKHLDKIKKRYICGK